MRRNGVELVERVSRAPDSPKNFWLWGGLPAAALVIIGGALWWTMGPPRLEDEVPTRPLSAKELRGYLERDGVTQPRWLSFLSVSPAPSGSSEELLALAKSKSERWSIDVPLDRPVLGAQETAAALEGDKQRYYPLELSVWLAAALREQGQDAVVAEVWEFDGDTRPPDPSGVLGYFGVVVGSGDDAMILDPMRGAARKAKAKGWRLLTDTQVVAAALGDEAMRHLMHTGDSQAALRLTERALALDPKSPVLRGVHASVLLDSRAIDDAVKELHAAHELRPDGPRKVSLVHLYIAQAGQLQMAGDPDAAAKQWGTAAQLAAQTEQLYPDFARAHIALAAVHLGQGDAARAKLALDRAEQLQPDSVMLPTALAQYYMQAGQPQEAAATMDRAVERLPNNWQVRLQAAQVHLVAGNGDRMRAHARAAVEMVPSEKRTELRNQILEALGETALDEPGVADEAEVEEVKEDEDIDLSTALPDPSRVVGAAAGGPITGDETQKLRLRDPGDSLQLDLDE